MDQLFSHISTNQFAGEKELDKTAVSYLKKAYEIFEEEAINGTLSQCEKKIGKLSVELNQTLENQAEKTYTERCYSLSEKGEERRDCIDEVQEAIQSHPFSGIEEMLLEYARKHFQHYKNMLDNCGPDFLKHVTAHAHTIVDRTFEGESGEISILPLIAIGLLYMAKKNVLLLAEESVSGVKNTFNYVYDSIFTNTDSNLEEKLIENEAVQEMFLENNELDYHM